MQLTRLERRNLDAMVYLCTGKPTLWRVLMFRPLCWLPYLLLVVFGIGYCWVDQSVGLLVLGMMVGAIATTIGRARVTLRVWPMMKEVINWEKVEALRTNKEV
jgi:hypothetical protein